MAIIRTLKQFFIDFFSTIFYGLAWLLSQIWQVQVWIWASLYKAASALYDFFYPVLYPVYHLVFLLVRGLYLVVYHTLSHVFLGLHHLWQWILGCCSYIGTTLYGWIKPLWLPLREDLLPIWGFIKNVWSVGVRMVSGWFAAVFSLFSRLQAGIVYCLQIPAAYTGLWQSGVISLVGYILQKVWAVPKEVDSVLADETSPHSVKPWVLQSLGVVTFLLSGLVMWPYLFGVVILPFSPHHLQWFVLAPVVFFLLRPWVQKGVDFFQARLTPGLAAVIHESVSLFLSLVGVWLANAFLLVAAPAASPFICMVSAATWAWFYLARPKAPRYIWYPSILAVCAGPLMYYATMVCFIALMSVVSVFFSAVMFTHMLHPLIFELALSAASIVGVACCGYALMVDMPSSRTWKMVLAAFVLGPPLAVLLTLAVPYLLLLFLYNSFLIYTLLAAVGTGLLLAGVHYLDKLINIGLNDHRPNAVNIFSSMTIVYAYLFFSLYAFCFIVPTFAAQVLPAVIVCVYMAGLTFVLTVYAVDRLADILHTFSPKQADDYGVRLWLFTALSISVAGNLGFTIPMFSWLPVIFTNIAGGIIIGMGVGVVSAFASVCLLRSLFPRVTLRDLYSCMVSGSVVVFAPWGLWHVVHMPLSSVVITLVFMKITALVVACQNLWAIIPLFYGRVPPPASGGLGPSSASSHGPDDNKPWPGGGPSAPPFSGDGSPSDPDHHPSGGGGTHEGSEGSVEPSAPPLPGGSEDFSDSGLAGETGGKDSKNGGHGFALVPSAPPIELDGSPYTGESVRLHSGDFGAVHNVADTQEGAFHLFAPSSPPLGLLRNGFFSSPVVPVAVPVVNPSQQGRRLISDNTSEVTPEQTQEANVKRKK